MQFSELRDEHQRLAYDLSEHYWGKLLTVLERGFDEVSVCTNKRDQQSLCEYYKMLPSVLSFKRMNLKLDCMKQDERKNYKIELEL